MSNVFNVKNYHYNIEDIIKWMELEPLAPETLERQREMESYWNTHIDEFYERLFWEPERLEKWKLEKLSKLVDWAFSTCPFYRDHYQKVGFKKGDINSLEDFSKLPSITKDDIINNFPIGIPSQEFSLKKCRWISTSGSSGKQVQIVLPQERANLDILFKYRMFEFQGGFRLDMTKWLYNIHYCLWWHTSIMEKLPVFSITQDCLPESALKHIKLIKPQVISSIGSYLNSLAKLGESLKDYGVKIISTNSETTTSQERKKWEEVFQVPVRDEYSTEELDILATECPYRSYHLVEDDVHVELINQDETGLGEVLGTDMWNYAMPIIRYEQEDLAIFEESSELCSCGSHFKRLQSFQGRADQMLENQYGEKIAPGSLLDAVELFLCKDEANIREFRVVQESPTYIKILFIPKGQIEHEREKIFSGFHKRLNTLFKHEVNLEPICLEEIPKDNSYKRRTIINKMKR